ncbi:hypothetical protein FB645_000538 [Coemansia sp. IMI 203386]|nr:hypothetical protein FB645_000538 [Coemansia sp. IMI 203386]
MSGSGDSSSTSAVFCAVCGQDITLLNVAMRNSHSEKCLDTDIPPQQNQLVMSIIDKPSFDASTLERLPDCPVCASAWPFSGQSRAAHVSECARRFSVSSKDLVDLINIFRESIESLSESSASAMGSVEVKRSKPRVRDPTTDRFIKAFTPPMKKISAIQTKRSKDSKGKGKSAATGKSLVAKPKRASAEPQACFPDSLNSIQSVKPASSTTSAASSPKPSFPFSRSSSSVSFDIPEDDDFQSNKMRVSLQQTRIAIGNRGKKQQSVLDELDDDLNEAKALSLSLKRRSDQLPSKPAQRRRDTGPKSVDLLASSDVLSSQDAQSFIRHRALELERIDKELYERDSYAASQPYSVESVETVDSRLHVAPEDAVQLWNLASLDSENAIDGRSICCPMFENFKMEHLRHDNTDECLAHVLDHILRSLAQMNSSSNDGFGSIDEKSLRSGYMALVKAARESFFRTSASLRCANWLSENDGIAASDATEEVVEKETAAAAAAIVLSSSSVSASQSRSPVEDPNPPISICSAVPENANNCSETPDLPTEADAGSGPRKQPAEKCPNYTKMTVDDLKRVASDFGLRTNTPRRLIEHQLKTIWEQTHQISVSNDSACSGNDSVPSQSVPESLAEQLRTYIRSKTALYESILCYRVLDFETTYNQISAAVPCKKAMLRRFFDNEASFYWTTMTLSAMGVLGRVSGAVVATNSLQTQDQAITRTMVSVVDTNLSHFIPQLLSEARAAEREAVEEGLLKGIEQAASTPTAATVDLFVDDVFTA